MVRTGRRNGRKKERKGRERLSGAAVECVGYVALLSQLHGTVTGTDGLVSDMGQHLKIGSAYVL